MPNHVLKKQQRVIVRARLLVTGLQSLFDCIPNCAEGHFHTYSAKIKLTRPRYCSDEGVEQYRRLSISYRGNKPTGPRSYSVPFPCPSAYARTSTTAGDPGASAVLAARIKARFPRAHQLFAN